MRSKKRFFAVAGVLAVAAGMFLSAPKASAANPGDSDTFNFVAPTLSLDPVESASKCHSPGLTGCGTGNYTFSTAKGTCADNSADTDGIAPDAETDAACSITSSGSYTNGTCGTGEAKGTAIVNEGPDLVGGKNPSDTYYVTYDIIFSGGRGVLTGTATEANSTEGTEPIAGTVQIVPLVGDCVTSDVSQFEVIGTVTSDI